MIWNKDSLKTSLYQGNRLSLRMTVQPVTGDKITLTEQNLLPGTFSIDRYVQSSDKLEIGSACASELSFVLDNLNGEFDNVMFEGAEIVVSVVITEDEYKIGTFTVDEKPRKLTTIKIKALDDMVKLDKPVDWSKFPSRSTMAGVISFACTECNVSYSVNDISNYFSLYTRTVAPPSDSPEMTYRDLIRYMCQLGIVNAYMDKSNILRFGWYGKVSTGYSITPYERTTHTIEEKSIGVASLTVEYEDTVITAENTSTDENVDYSLSFTIEDNPFAATTATESVVSSLFDSKLKNLTYRPFSASIKQMFPLEPMDGIVFEDKNGNEVSTFLTHTNFKLNGNMKIEAKGECKTKSGYASMNPLTAQEQKILNDLRKFVTTETAKVTPREYQLIEFNKAMNAGMAMYKTDVDGVTYYHDKAELANSSYILVQNSAGIAWTDSGWNNGSPVWEYGLSSDGQTILSSLDAYSIRADLITVTDLKAFGATIGGWNIGESRIWSKGSTPFLPYTETKSYINKNTGNLVNSSVNVKLTDYIRVTPKEKYIYTGSGINGTVVASVVWYDMSQNFISAEQSFGENIIFTVPANCYYARFQAYTPASSTEETVLKVKNQSDEEKYTFFTPVTSGSDPVWVSGAESLDSYDSAGFILYGDGRVRMGGNKNEGYIMASDNMLHFYGGEYNASASLQFSVGLLHDYNVFDFVGWSDEVYYNFYSGYKPFLKISFENGVIKTNYSDRTDNAAAEIPIGLQHYHRIGANSVRADFGIGNQNGEPSALMAAYEKKHVDEEVYYEITSRLEVFKNTSGAALVNLRVSNSDTDFTPLKFGKNQIWYAGEITANGTNLSASTEELKLKVSNLEEKVNNIDEYLLQLDAYLKNQGG